MPELTAAVNALRKAVDDLRADYDANATATHELAGLFARRLGWQRLWLGVLALLLAVAVVSGWQFRAQEHRRVKDQRANLIQGCERGNDQRATLREVISGAYEPTPTPDGLSPELAKLLRQSQERALVRRDTLLSLDGVQPVDCEAAYPPSGNR